MNQITPILKEKANSMLFFTDLNFAKHFINISNINNVVIRQQTTCHVFAFHMNNQAVLPITVDRTTAEHLMKKLEEKL